MSKENTTIAESLTLLKEILNFKVKFAWKPVLSMMSYESCGSPY